MHEACGLSLGADLGGSNLCKVLKLFYCQSYFHNVDPKS